VLIDPVTDQVTYLVVKADSSPNTEYNVPVEFVTKTIDDTVRLSCSMAELEKMKPFIKTTVIEERVPARNADGGYYGMGTFYYLPYDTPDVPVQTFVEHQQIPPGELAVSRGTRIEATDGYVGKGDELVVNPENSHITHFVMREGHLWGKKDVTIPISAMGETRDDTVFVKLDKDQIESLPIFPVHRIWS
jgi:hypothetical protein